MKPSKILADLISSATGAKTHYDVWWAQISDAKPQHVGVMNEHNDFFRASQDAHYTACFIYLAHLFDKRSDSSSLPTYLAALSTGQNPQSPQEILEFLGEVEGDVTQEIEAMAEEGLERSPKGFFKGIGRS